MYYFLGTQVSLAPNHVSPLVRWLVGHTFYFLSKVLQQSNLRQTLKGYTECSNLVANMVNVLEVNKVADMVADMEVDQVADMVVDEVADMVSDNEVDKVADMVAAMEVDKMAEKMADMFKTMYIKPEMF